MAVVRLGAGAGGTGTTSATWTGFNIVSSNAQTVAIVFMNASTSSAATTCTPTYGGVSMKQLGLVNSAAGFAAVGIYYLFNPPAGANTVVVTPGGASTKNQVQGIDVVFTNVSSLGAAQNVLTMAHTVTSVANGYAVRVLSNGVTAGTLNQTTELSAGASVTGVGDFIAVQSAAGAATVSFTASGTATTPLSMGCTVNAVGQINFVQTVEGTTVTALTGTALLPGPCQVGDTIVAAFKVSNLTTAVFSTIADTSGNTYSVACPKTAGALGATGRQIWVYYAPVTTASDPGTNTITVTFTTTAPTSLTVFGTTYDGLHPTKPFDQHKEATASSGTALDSGSTPTTTQANELVFGIGVGANSATAAGAGFTGRNISAGSSGSLVEDKTVATIGAYNALGTFNTTGEWIMGCATFKQAPLPPVLYQGLSIPVRRSAFY